MFPLPSLSNILLRMWGGVAVDPVLVSIPMFIFMGSILERSGSAKDMLSATEILLKRVPGGLAVAVMVMGTILAAPIGVVGAAVVLLSLIALPQMLAVRLRQAARARHHRIGRNARHPDPAGDHAGGDGRDAQHLGRRAVCGSDDAGLPALGPLSALHPRRRDRAARSARRSCPPTSARRRRAEFWRTMWKGLFPMTFLMVVVLGSIFAGWATATESAGVGVLGSFIIAALNGRLNLAMANDAIRSACRANAMVFLIFLGATGFSYVFRTLGGDDVMVATLAHFGIDTKWEMLTFVMVLIFLLGFPFEWIEICLIVLPIFAPILMKFDFADHLGDKAYLMPWFGTLVAVNLQTSFMTPPFGATLFYMKGTVPPGITMSDVYRGMYPFVALAGHRPAVVHLVPLDRAMAAEGDRAAGLAAESGFDQEQAAKPAADGCFD